ncbi:MAG: hypothetical protein Q9219_006966 [cf. Caloplaca sp. 3 TL-2023]
MDIQEAKLTSKESQEFPGRVVYHRLAVTVSSVEYSQYTSLIPSNRWMAYPTLPIIPFVNLWMRRFERLIWMPVPTDIAKGKVEWYFTTTTREDEEDILAHDGEYIEDDQDEDIDTDEEATLEGEHKVGEEEVSNLWRDAFTEIEGQQKREQPESSIV